MKLLHNFVAALFFIYHAYATSTNTEPCEKKDDSGTFLFICLVVGFFIIKHSEDKRRDRNDDPFEDSDEDEEIEEDSGDEADTDEGSDAEESEEEIEQEEDDSDAEESEEEVEPVEPEPKTRKSRRLGSKATLADSHS